MKPLFTEEQLNRMSKENIIALMQAMQEHGRSRPVLSGLWHKI